MIYKYMFYKFDIYIYMYFYKLRFFDLFRLDLKFFWFVRMIYL